ncbi:DNA-3-methyladenine glycosylase I [Falsigemmobacter faecalis]|uniref:DNA-3-methyladenine glycosylase I n=1 Tax=Falsigemmobacter faecalis TaxID=2488730 RepID=A0A3P3DWC9_9RHOB|nr:DNA-3-methyladenine glycosylase I [Falsigemmobacter faecalis]RRH78573.1 DNA-3-methyladenine glycosylase I [Falsigemmobacter faecalis]
MQTRCAWCGTDPLYVRYHDEEWGIPETDGRTLWELLMLEGFQAGLSWITILRRRESFREAFAGFDPQIIATWGEAEVAVLLQNPGIIRHRGKIEATIQAARSFLRLEAEPGGFSGFIWRFTNGAPLQNALQPGAPIPAQTDISLALSKALKREGFKFCGPTITYAFMQAAGLVNDHLTSCLVHDRVAALGGPQNL